MSSARVLGAYMEEEEWWWGSMFVMWRMGDGARWEECWRWRAWRRGEGGAEEVADMVREGRALRGRSGAGFIHRRPSRDVDRAGNLMGGSGSRQAEESHGQWPNLRSLPIRLSARPQRAFPAVFQSILITPPSLLPLPL